MQKRNARFGEIIDHCGYIMDATGFHGLSEALKGKENAVMIKDQMYVVDCVKDHLQSQMEQPKKEIIVISGGPGTGKTIVGMHFIYDYAQIFNGGENADGSVFCLPRSKTVKAVIDHACGGAVVPYLDGIGSNQNLVVIDEAHRMTGLDSALDKVFNKGSRLVIMLQDDHQRIRPGEDGTSSKIEDYARANKIQFKKLNLTIQKRCESLGEIINGLEAMFYGAKPCRLNPIAYVKVFDGLNVMDSWIQEKSKTSRAKFIAPFCWDWKGTDGDVSIRCNGALFEKSWNPSKSGHQVQWYYDTNTANKIASIYTCQGLDFDHVAFIWWDDLKWDSIQRCWVADIEKSRDNSFKNGVKKAKLTQTQITNLVVNTYYVMLSRARKRMGIWFKDKETQKYVMNFLGLEMYTPACKGAAMQKLHQPQPISRPKIETLIGVVSHVNHISGYGYIQGNNGISYGVSEKNYEKLSNPKALLKVGNMVSFTTFESSTGKQYADNIKLEGQQDGKI